MASKPPAAVLDACVLYPFHLRNLLIQAAVDGLFDARWTDDIHEEWIRNLAANATGVSRERLQTTRDKMMAVLACRVLGRHRSTQRKAPKGVS